MDLVEGSFIQLSCWSHWYVLQVSLRGRLWGLVNNFEDALFGGCVIWKEHGWSLILDAARIYLHRKELDTLGRTVSPMSSLHAPLGP